MAKEKKVESKKTKIINAVIMAIEIVVIIVGIAFSITMITGKKASEDELGKGTNVTAVLSDSMDGSVNNFKVKSFKIGDLLLIKSIKDNAKAQSELKVGDVITYTGVGPTGEFGLISHRIIKIEDITVGEETIRRFYTLGDKQYTGNQEIDEYNAKAVLSGNVQGIVTGQISKLGYAIIWLQDSTHFLLAVVLPLALLLIYNLYIFIKMILDYKIRKVKEQNEMAVEALKVEGAAAIDEEEIKRKAIEEYLASQKAKVAEDMVTDSSNSEEKIAEDK